jgi:hypothetical protein
LQPTDTAAGKAGVCTAPRYGYTGQLRCGTHIVDVNWFSSGTRESFGIAPNGRIWHAWPRSGGGKEIPSHGRADDTYGFAWSYPSRTAAVVKNGCDTLRLMRNAVRRSGVLGWRLKAVA